jgi:hypothetical protein
MQEAIQSAVSVRDFVLLKNAMGNNTTVAEDSFTHAHFCSTQRLLQALLSSVDCRIPFPLPSSVN